MTILQKRRGAVCGAVLDSVVDGDGVFVIVVAPDVVVPNRMEHADCAVSL